MLAGLRPEQVTATEFAGEPITAKLTTAGNGAPIGGLKVTTASGWFAAHPSGTEDVYRIYAESFQAQTTRSASKMRPTVSSSTPSIGPPAQPLAHRTCLARRSSGTTSRCRLAQRRPAAVPRVGSSLPEKPSACPWPRWP